jgi:small redox-active disulfide protein 2
MPFLYPKGYGVPVKSKDEDEIRRINIGGNSVGIVGLVRSFEEVSRTCQGKSDDETKKALVGSINKQNYIPKSSREAYGKALLNEYKKYKGLPYETDTDQSLTIRILGPGCARCDMLERTIIDALSEMETKAAIEHVTDMRKIGEYDLWGTPALLINEAVLSVGIVPSKDEIKKWITEVSERIEKGLSKTAGE